MTNTNQSLALTVKQAREALGGLSQTLFYDIINSGELKTFKIGRRRLISREELQRYISELQQRESEGV